MIGPIGPILSIILCALFAAFLYSFIDIASEKIAELFEDRRNKKRWKEVNRLENRTPYIVTHSTELQE